MHVHIVYLYWLEAMLESNLRRGWKSQASELRDTLYGRDWQMFQMHLEAMIEWKLEDNMKVVNVRHTWWWNPSYQLVNFQL